MSKKHKKKLEQKKTMEAGGGAPEDSLSSRGKKTILGGICLLASGFFLLTFTDPAGRNWASNLSPFIILGAYGVIAWGIFRPDPPPAAAAHDLPPPAASGPAA